MSTAHGGDRRRLGGRGHLVLLRGGLGRAEAVAMGETPKPRPEDADWRAFCARIGWQHAEAALPDDYEERLAARIFSEDARHDGWPLAGAADPLLPVARSQSGRPPSSSMASAAMAVAAVLCVAASVVLWRAARPPAGAVACPDVEAPPRATIAPLDDRADDRAAPVAPSERRRDAELRTKDAPTPPAPRETKPRKPPAPGALVARRSPRDDARPRVALGAAGSPAQGAEHAPPRDRQDDAAESDAPIAAADLQSPDARPRGVALVASALPVIPRTWPVSMGETPRPPARPDARTSDAWTRPASFGVVPASATWSLSPGNPRWYGVGLPPSSASAALPSGVGVMGQLDLGKAIDRL